jgi:hypothetical protein
VNAKDRCTMVRPRSQPAPPMTRRQVLFGGLLGVVLGLSLFALSLFFLFVPWASPEEVGGVLVPLTMAVPGLAFGVGAFLPLWLGDLPDTVVVMANVSLAGLALPDTDWWDRHADPGNRRTRSSSPSSSSGVGRVGRGELEAVRETASFFYHLDQRRGGGHARTVVVQYLLSDVTPHLRGRYGDDQVRREMFALAGRLACLSGRMAFDEADHATAQRWYVTAVNLAAEADDAPLAVTTPVSRSTCLRYGGSATYP